MVKRFTNEIVDKRLEGSDICRIGDYKGDKVFIDWKCKICNHLWEAIPNYIFKGAKCPNCSTKKSITNDIFDERIQDLSVVRVGEYKGSEFFIDMKCLVCKKKYSTKAKYPLHHKTECPYCNSFDKYTNQTLDQKIKSKEVLRIGDYINITTKIDFSCKKCNHVWKASPSNIIRGQGCPKCKYDYKKLDNQIIDDRIKDYSLVRIGDIVDSSTKVNWKCLSCGHIWSATPNNILRGRKCPKCTLKQKESRVATYLKELCSINFDIFIPEYRILRNPKTNRFLPFDIYLEHEDLKFLIEIHGKQHYELVGGYYNSIEDFNYRKEIDSFKKSWAIKNDFIFIEVPANFKKTQCEKLIKEIKNNNIKGSINYYEKQ